MNSDFVDRRWVLPFDKLPTDNDWPFDMRCLPTLLNSSVLARSLTHLLAL